MTDIRMQRLANVLVHYALDVQPGQWVALGGDIAGLPLLREAYRALVAAGAQVSTSFTDEHMARTLYREAADAQLNWINPARLHALENADAYLFIRSTENTRAMSNIDPKRVQQVRAAQMPLSQTIARRTAAGEFNWVLTQFPTEASAQEANMSLEEYADFIYSATFCDTENPVAEWEKISKMQAQKIDWLKGKKQVRLNGPNIDLELAIADRTFINADGKRNMPDGEIFTGPIEDSVNGWVRFSYPSIVGGRAVSGIELRFKDGKVIEASAEQNEDLLHAQLDTDAGARYLGEFAIGTNFGIQQFTGNILFDEKIGGTVHMAIGNGYPETGSKNVSAVHWDMICDMRTGSEIRVDGDLFYKDGAFTV